MNFFAYLRVDIRRVFISRITWLITIITACAPLIGYGFNQMTDTSSRATSFIAVPVSLGSIIGALLFALLTIYELDRVYRSGISEITDTIVSPQILSASKTVSVLITALCTGIAITIIYFPYTLYKTNYLFDIATYLGSFLIIYVPTLIISTFMAACFYLITRRNDLSFIMVIVCALPCFGSFIRGDFILRWINPIVPYYSDMFPNTMILRTAFYNRLYWLTFLTGTFILSLLCVRRYGKGIFRSFIINSRKIAKPFAAVVLIFAAACMYKYQPFVNHAPMDFGSHDVSSAINLYSMHTEAKPNTRTGVHHGKTTYTLGKTESPTECYLELNCGYTVKSITANGEQIDFTDMQNDLYISKLIRFDLPKGSTIELVVEYGGFPQMWSSSALILAGPIVCDDYIELLGASFAPLISASMDIAFNNTADVVLPNDLVPVLTDGMSERIKDNGDGTSMWHLKRGRHTMIYMYAADYIRKEVAANDVTAEFYYVRKNNSIMEKYGISDALKNVFDYCSKTYGKLVFQNEGYIRLLQHTGGGGYANKGTSVIGEMSFSEDTLKDPQRGASGHEVMAHEIAHQWWGLAVQFEGEYTGYSEWSSEGITVYATYRMAKELYGDDYAKENYIDKWQEAVDARNRSFYHRNPEYLDILPEQYSSSIRANESSVNRYNAMPLKILKAAELIGGEDKMDDVLRQLYEIKSSDYSTLSYSEFLDVCGLAEEELVLD